MTGVRPPFQAFGRIDDPDAPIESLGDLSDFHAAGCKPRSLHRVGVEAERLPLLASGEAAPYSAEGPCVEGLLRHLASEEGWDAVLEGGRLLGLSRPDAAVHLEPGAQLELALGPRASGADVLVALRSWEATLERAAGVTGVHAVALGLQPLTPIPRIGWVPKERYAPMREALERRGDLAHHMMKGTASVQVSLDYESEEDAGEKLRTALALMPIVNATCANSPLEEGRGNGHHTKRPLIWSRTDPARVGLLPWAFEGGPAFARWVDWALGVPPLFVIRDGRHVRLAARRFADFLRDGDERAGRATHADYQLHVTTLFPEVRLKQYLEVRGQDSVPAPLAAGLAALWLAVLGSPEARREALRPLSGLDARGREELHFAVGRHGLAARVGARRVRDLARELLDLAREAAAPGDKPLLESLVEVVSSGVTPAERLLRAWNERRDPAVLLER